MSSSSSYYYSLLDKESQKVYYAIREGLSHLAPSFSVPKLPERNLFQIYSMVRMDHPELFYSVRYRYRFYDHADSLEMMPEYILPMKKLKPQIEAMESRIAKVARQAEKLNEREKEQFIHDFLIENVTYDKLKKAYSHEIIGALGNGTAVCEGIAKAVKVLCDRLGIWCIVALAENNPEKGVKYRHAWNVVRIEGTYYHLDVTFDNTLSREGVIRYDYFNLGDEQIFRDHERLVYPVPACGNHKGFYYLAKKLSFTKEEDVRKRSLQAVKKGRVLIFQWRGGYLSRDKVQEFFAVFREEAEKKNKRAKVKLNWSQAVFQVSFIDDVTEPELEMEEANEGERYGAPEE